MKKFIFCFIIVLVCFSCSESSENEIVVFPVNNSYEDSGTFLEKETGDEYIFFAKRNFDPHLKIFDSQAVFKDSISLKRAAEAVGKIADVWMTSKDSIFVFSTNTQKYVVVNEKGELIFEKHFRKTVQDEKANFYELYPPFMQCMDMRGGDEVVYTTFWVDNSKYSPEENKNRSVVSIMNHIRDGYLMSKERGRSTDVTPAFGVQITDFVELSGLGQSVFYPSHKTLVLNNRYFLLTYYSRYIYELNADLDITDRFKIVPDNLSITEPFPVVGDDVSFEDLDEQIEIQSYISNLMYCKEKNQFAVILKIGKSVDDIFSYPFKVLIYDSGFERLLKSFEYTSLDYTPGSSFILFDKLYLEKKSTEHEKRYFEVIKL